jgi:hypothetical protein
MSKFTDGLKSFVSSLVNSRDPLAQNYFDSTILTDEDRRQIYRTGIGNKIVRLKAGYALKDTLQFDRADDEKFYKRRLEKHVKAAARWMVAMGRGIIVLHMRGDDLSKPLGRFDSDRGLFSVFSGDMVTQGSVDMDLQSPRYYKPITYNVRGKPIHYSRVIDFTYVQPPDLDAPKYRYGGVSEYDLIYQQLVADGIVQRASPRILDKASTLFYKIKGFKTEMQSGNEADMVNYFSRLEELRGIWAAGLIDQEDEVEVVTQTLSNLAEADQITLRRLAMVTGIPLAMLVGENVKGLNSTGDNERLIFQEMIETVQSDYLIEPINELLRACGVNDAMFKENQGETPQSKIEYETKAIDNAVKLAGLGEDYRDYLKDKGILTSDDFDQVFGESDEGSGDGTNGGSGGDVDVDPSESLNGAQVTAILEIVSRIRRGEITKSTARQIVITAFPVTSEQADRLLADVVEPV